MRSWKIPGLRRQIGTVFSPGESAAALGIAQLLPAIIGLALGYVAGTLLFHASPAHIRSPHQWLNSSECSPSQ